MIILQKTTLQLDGIFFLFPPFMEKTVIDT